MDLIALLLSRLQFAFTVSFHIFFPSFTIGLAAWLTVLEALRLATGRPAYRVVFEFWLRIFAVAFGLGVSSGIVLAFQNPDFGAVAQAVGLWGRSVKRAGDLEDAIQAWLAQPAPALLDVKVKPMQLVTPPSPFVSPEAIVGMGVYTAKAMLQGKGHDVWEMAVENLH
jgi:hypothetical protein